VYATMVQCAMPGVASPHARGRLGRTLAAALGALPGFVAFVAFDGDLGVVAALCLFEDHPSMDAAQHVIARWQRDEPGAGETEVRYLCAGEVIVQKGI
jgi:hypothetical protein